jgi:hypothetical protein
MIKELRTLKKNLSLLINNFIIIIDIKYLEGIISNS